MTGSFSRTLAHTSPRAYTWAFTLTSPGTNTHTLTCCSLRTQASAPRFARMIIENIRVPVRNLLRCSIRYSIASLPSDFQRCFTIILLKQILLHPLFLVTKFSLFFHFRRRIPCSRRGDFRLPTFSLNITISITNACFTFTVTVFICKTIW